MKIQNDEFLEHLIKQQKELVSSIDYILRMYRGRKLISIKDLVELQEVSKQMINNVKSNS